MRGERRGFTLIEVMVVMFITALVLPAIGSAFWMLLSVPPKETGKLTTINDVTTAFNWIRDDAMRAQYYSGSPQMLEKVIVIDFNDCNQGSDCNAWYSSGDASAEPDPGVGSAASGDNYNQISQSDLVRWVTDGTEDNDGHYNYQVYEFTIDPAEYPRTDINRLSAAWVGYGEAHSGYDTTFRVWNHNSGSWETLVSRDALGEDAALAGALDPTKHVSDAGTVYLLAKAEHYHDAGGNSCPFIFGWNGTGYQFVDVAFPDVFLKRYETTSYPRTDILQAVDGYYDLMIHQSLPETGYINSLELWAVDHPEGSEVLVEQSMVMATERSGTIHTIREPQPVTAVDRDGNDVTALLAERDGEYWGSELEGKDFSDVDNLFDWVTITMPDMPDSGSAKLVIDSGETMLGKFQLWYCSQHLIGTPNLDYFYNRLETDEDFYRYFDLTVWLSSAFTVQYWDGAEWVDYVDIGFVDFLGRPQVVTIDLADIEGNRVRLHTPIGLREIDYVAVDYAPDEAVTVVEIEPAEVTQHFTDGTEADVLDAITAADESYAVLEMGDIINCRYPELPPPAEGYRRTFVIPAGGYYYVRGPEVPFDWIDRLSLAEELTYVPYAFSKWTLPRYAHPEEYDWQQYYPVSYDHFTPTFPPKETNSLNSNYVKLTVVVPKEEEEQTMESVVYGSFSWVDRTGSQSHSYTAQYYWDNGRLMREEWEDNNLRSSIAVAHNIENIEDVQFSFYPRGNLSRPPGKEGEAYIKVLITSSTGSGDYRQVATSTEHYVLRGKGLGRGYAILARGRSGNPVDIRGLGLMVQGNVYSYRGVYIGCGEHSFTGEVEATGQIDDPCGALTADQLKRFSTRADTSWSLMLSDFVHLPEYKDREFVYDRSSGDDWDLANCDTCYINKIVHEGGAADSIWEPDGFTLKTGVYYNPYGNVTLTTTNVTGLVTLIGERVIVTADYSRLSALSNGVVACATGTDDAAVWYNSADPAELGTVWSGSVFAPSGGVHIGGKNFAMYGVAAAMRFYYDGENALILY